VRRIVHAYAAACLCGALLSLIPTAQAAGGEEATYTGHLELLRELGTEAVDEVLAELALPAGAAVHLVPETAHPANWLVARLFEQALVARGHAVMAPAFGREAGGAGARLIPAADAAPPASDESGPLDESFFVDEREAEPGEAQGAEAESEEDDAFADEELSDEGDAADAQDVQGASEGDAQARSSAAPSAQPAAEAEAGEGQAAAADAAGAAAGGEGAESEDAASAEPAFALLLPGRGEVVAFRVVDCGVSYPWARRSLLVGPRRFGRMASVRLWAAHLSQPGQRMRGVARSEQIHFDSFPAWARPLVEGPGYPFPIEAPGGASMQKLVEPVVVAGIVTGLVYLFYQNQN